MNCLLDTHALIWYRTGNKSFTTAQKKLVEQNEIYVSIASVWEVALLMQKRKLSTTLNLETFLKDLIQPNFRLINMEISDFVLSNKLPNHHKDPFDRLLIAQAIERDLTLITKDAIIPKYPVKTQW